MSDDAKIYIGQVWEMFHPDYPEDRDLYRIEERFSDVARWGARWHGSLNVSMWLSDSHVRAGARPLPGHPWEKNADWGKS